VLGGSWFDIGDMDAGDHLTSVERVTDNGCFGG
jgi:hypothetical protein